jgi:hypothetical protein
MGERGSKHSTVRVSDTAVRTRLSVSVVLFGKESETGNNRRTCISGETTGNLFQRARHGGGKGETPPLMAASQCRLCNRIIRPRAPEGGREREGIRGHWARPASRPGRVDAWRKEHGKVGLGLAMMQKRGTVVVVLVVVN